MKMDLGRYRQNLYLQNMMDINTPHCRQLNLKTKRNDLLINLITFEAITFLFSVSRIEPKWSKHRPEVANWNSGSLIEESN